MSESSTEKELDMASMLENSSKRLNELKKKLNEETREQIELQSLENRLSKDILSVAARHKIEIKEGLDLQSQLNDFKSEAIKLDNKDLIKYVDNLEEEYNLEKKIIGQKGISAEISNIISQIEKNIVSEGKTYVSLIDKMITRKGALAKNTELFVFLLKQGLEIFVSYEKAAEAFRKETGLTISQSREQRALAEQINAEYQRFGVNIEDAYKSISAVQTTFGGLRLETRETTETASLLAANFGVAAENTAQVLSKFQGLGGVTQAVSINTIKSAAAISRAAGVPFAKVMEDVAKASDDVLVTVGATPQKLLAASIQARALGIDLNTAASAARKLLDFNTSINDELNASALLGRSVNFQKARQLAFDGNIVEANKEILRQVRMAGNFDEMNVFQKEALAKAAGMELSSLNKMMAVENIRRRGTLDQRERLRSLDDQLERMEKLTKETGEHILLEREMQSVMTNLNNAFKQFGVALGSILSPALVKIAGGLEVVAKFMGDVISQISKWEEGTKLFWGSVIIFTVLGVAIYSLIKVIKGLILIKKAAAVAAAALTSATTVAAAADIKKSITTAAGTKATAVGTQVQNMSTLAIKRRTVAINALSAAMAKNVAATTASTTAAAASTAATRGLGAGAASIALAIKPILIGAAAMVAIAVGIAALGGSLIVLGKGFKSIGEGIKDIDALNLLKIGGAISLLTASLAGIGLLAAAGILGLVLLTFSLSRIGKTIKGMDAEMFEKIGTGIKDIVTSFANVSSAKGGLDFMKSLSEISINDDVINKLERLATLSSGLMQTALGMEKLSSAVSSLSEVNYDAINVGTISKVAEVGTQTSVSSVNMNPVVEAINLLRTDLLDGKIAVYMDGTLVHKALAGRT